MSTKKSNPKRPHLQLPKQKSNNSQLNSQKNKKILRLQSIKLQLLIHSWKALLDTKKDLRKNMMNVQNNWKEPNNLFYLWVAKKIVGESSQAN